MISTIRLNWSSPPPSNVPPAGESEEKWQRELANGSQSVILRDLKEGLSYRVRLVARGHHDQPLHLSEELLVTVPGEATIPALASVRLGATGRNV